MSDLLRASRRGFLALLGSSAAAALVGRLPGLEPLVAVTIPSPLPSEPSPLIAPPRRMMSRLLLFRDGRWTGVGDLVGVESVRHSVATAFDLVHPFGVEGRAGPDILTLRVSADWDQLRALRELALVSASALDRTDRLRAEMDFGGRRLSAELPAWAVHSVEWSAALDPTRSPPDGGAPYAGSVVLRAEGRFDLAEEIACTS